MRKFIEYLFYTFTSITKLDVNIKGQFYLTKTAGLYIVFLQIYDAWKKITRKMHTRLEYSINEIKKCLMFEWIISTAFTMMSSQFATNCAKQWTASRSMRAPN